MSPGRPLRIAVAALASALVATGAAAAERVVSVGGAITEIVYAIGAQESLVGVDSTSTFPPEAAALPDVGYLRQLSAEPILSLRPTLVLAAADAGPPAAIEQLRGAGVRVVPVPGDHTPEGVIEKVAIVAAALHREQAGAALRERLEHGFDRIARLTAGARDRPRVLFLLSVGGGLLAAGVDTSADAMISLAGGTNAVGGFSGYKPLSAEVAVAAAPDVILTTDRILAALGGADELLRHPALAATPAARSGTVLGMDDLFLLGFGPRTPEAVERLALAFATAR